MGHDWLHEEVCCGFLWYQFEDLSNWVKYCPLCGKQLSDIPVEALE